MNEPGVRAIVVQATWQYEWSSKNSMSVLGHTHVLSLNKRDTLYLVFATKDCGNSWVGGSRVWSVSILRINYVQHIHSPTNEPTNAAKQRVFQKHWKWFKGLSAELSGRFGRSLKHKRGYGKPLRRREGVIFRAPGKPRVRLLNKSGHIEATWSNQCCAQQCEFIY